MEMETFMLFHLAACCKPKEPIYASAAAIVVANRMSTKVAEGDLLDRMEIEGGKSILRAITRMEI